MWPGFLIDHMHVLYKKALVFDKWVNLGSGECTEPSLVWNRLLTSSWRIWCPEFSFSRILCMGPLLYSEEVYGIVSYLIFSVPFYITFKRNFSMWVTRGSYVDHIWITLWVSGSSESTSVTHFQPWSGYQCITNSQMIKHLKLLINFS